MPRKPKPPHSGLLIQGLSDLKTVKPEGIEPANTFTDDFTGEVRPLDASAVQADPEYVKTAPIVPREGPMAKREREQAQRQHQHSLVMKALRPEPKLAVPKGWRIAYDKDGKPLMFDGKVVLIKNNPLRRV